MMSTHMMRKIYGLRAWLKHGQHIINVSQKVYTADILGHAEDNIKTVSEYLTVVFHVCDFKCIPCVL